MLGAEFSPDVRRALRVDVSATLLVALFAGLVEPFVGLILRRDLGATPLQLSLMSSATGACLLLSLLWARAVRAHAPLPVLVWTGVAARGVFVLVPLVTSAWMLAGLVAAASFFGAATQPARAAVVERVYPAGERGRALGLARMAAAALGIVLALGAGQLFERVDWRWIFPAAALVGMAASLRQLALDVPPPAAERPAAPAGRGAFTAVRADHTFRRLLVASFLFGAGCWVQTPAYPLLLVDVLGAGAAHVGVFAAAAAAAALVGGGGWGWLVDRRGTLEALRLMYLVGAATPLIYFVAWSPWVLVASAATDSLMAVGLEVVWMLAVIDVAGPKRTAQYVAIGATLAGVRGVLGPLAGGVLIHLGGVHAVFLVAAALMLAGAWVAGRGLAARVPARAISPSV